jgi:hypothetical protein
VLVRVLMVWPTSRKLRMFSNLMADAMVEYRQGNTERSSSDIGAGRKLC